MTQFSNEDMVTIGVKTERGVVLISSVYMPYDSQEGPVNETIKVLVDLCYQKKWELILGGDTNCHHTAWGSTGINGRGTQLYDFVVTSDLGICNTGNKPTFSIKNRSEVIDCTFATFGIVDYIKKWQVLDIESFSDHNYIAFILDTTTNMKEMKIYNPRKTNWNAFKERLELFYEGCQYIGSNSQEGTRKLDIDKTIELMEKSIVSSFERCTKPSKINKTKGNIRWNNSLKAMKKNLVRLRRKLKRNNYDPNIKEELYQKEKEYKKEISNCKNKSWKNFTSEIDNLSAGAKLNKILKKDNICLFRTVMKSDGGYTANPEETVEALLGHHFEDLEEESLNEHIWDLTEGKNMDSPCLKYLNREVVKEALKLFSPYKSPGPDGLRPIMIKNSLDVIIEDLVEVYRECIITGKIPTSWKRTKVVFIPKPGKSDYSSPSSFRPISLTSFLLKGFERVILWYLNENILHSNIWHKHVFAYRQGLSTESALHKVISNIEKAKEYGNHVVVVFLDIESAFNKVPVFSMIRALKKVGTDMALVRLIGNILSDREILSEMSGESAEIKVGRGCPQGGILSPVLWNLVMNEAMKTGEKVKAVKPYGYADDLSLLAQGIDMNTIIDNLQYNLNIYEKWADENHLRFSPSKTKAMVFTNKRKYNMKAITIHGKKIEIVDTFKYLGVTIDNRLTWNQHINTVRNKAMASLQQCRKVVGKDWGVTPKVTMWLFVGVIRPILLYSSIVWTKAMEDKTKVDRLSKVQNIAMRMICSGRKSTPTKAMEVILGLEPIDIKVKETALKTMQRLIATDIWEPGIPGVKNTHNKYLESLVKKAGLTKEVMEVDRKMPTTPARYQTNIEERQNYPEVQVTPECQTQVHCYTDGSKDEMGRTGTAYCIKGKLITGQWMQYLGTNCTVFQAELMAINLAAYHIDQLDKVGLEYNFFIDNQAAIKALEQVSSSNKFIHETKLKLNDICRNNQVTLRWIPGHQGHLGNEIADRLAKLGGKSIFVGPLPVIPISNTIVGGEVRNWANMEHNKTWKLYKGGRQTKLFFNELRPPETKKILNLKRTEIGKLIAILTGHGNIGYHRYLIGDHIDGLCKCNQELESYIHVVTCCPLYLNLRREILGSYLIHENDLPKICTIKVLRFINRTKCDVDME